MISKQTLIDFAKDSPLPAATGLTLLGVRLDTWILALTAVWAVIRAASAAWDFYWKIKDRRDQSK